MKIRVVRSFGAYKAGQVFEWGDGMARIFQGRGLIVPVDDEKPEERIETAAVEHRTERAVIDQKPRKKQK